MMYPHELVKAGQRRTATTRQIATLDRAIIACQEFRDEFYPTIGKDGHQVETMMSNVFTQAKRELKILRGQVDEVKQ